MRTVLSAKPYLSGVSPLFYRDPSAVRCGYLWPQRVFAHGKDTHESACEARTPQSGKSNVLRVRCCDFRTSRCWPHEKAARESIHETQAPPQQSDGLRKPADAVGEGQTDWGLGEIGEGSSAPHNSGDGASLGAWLRWLRRRCGAPLARARAAWAALWLILARIVRVRRISSRLSWRL
jgi:hypothetical protein